MERTSYCSNKRIYTCWTNMKSRCNSPNKREAKYYHERGISYCSDWEIYANFESWALENGYADNLTLDRIDGTKGYCPENCRWITLEEQQRNKSNNIFLTRDGVTKTLTEWAREFDIDRTTLHDRIFKFGYSFDEAIKKSYRHNRKSILFEYEGETINQKEFARRLGVSGKTVSRWRIKGYSTDEIIAKAKGKGRPVEV